jgi:hypothetical protein
VASFDYSEAELYVDTDDRNLLKPVLVAHWQVAPVYSFFELQGFTVSVGKHKGHVRGASPDHFLGWRTLIDVTAGEETTDHAMLDFMGDLVGALYAAGYRSEAVCSFSDKIRRPEERNGG